MKTREELEALGRRILTEMRTELYVALPVMGPALDALGYQMDVRTRTIGTDAAVIRFHPHYLAELFLAHPRRLLRCYLHMLFHCLFRHFAARKEAEDPELFDLCADIAAEALLDSLKEDAVSEIPTDFRESWYRTLRADVQVLTAQKLYRYFTEHPPEYTERLRLIAEFARDDHQFWEQPEQNPPDRPNPPPPSERERDWQDRAKSTRDQIAALGQDASDEQGSLSWLLTVEESGTDYRDFLRRFITIREEVRIDPDSFDYGYYTYGLSLFGNLPLIEENEFRESVGVDQLVIAIDTSGSTRGPLVQRFLNETAAILASGETFLHRVEIHVIECDNRIQRDLVLTDVRDLADYAGRFEVSGGMGTDFRPVFAYVRELMRRGELSGLRGLLYFTDGFGTYPAEATPYDTAFVFCKDAPYDDRGVPGWAMKLYAGQPDGAIS